MGGMISRLVCPAMGFLYPAYRSWKALNTEGDADDKEWLMYWIVFAGISVAEPWADFFVSWFPFYYEAKIALYLWLQLPQTKGASHLYNTYVQPYLRANETKIDALGEQAKEIAKQKAAELKDKGIAYAQQKAGELGVQQAVNNIVGQVSAQISAAASSSSAAAPAVDKKDA